MSWTEFGKRWENSVLRIISHYANYDITRPYGHPSDRKSIGTGFIVDIENGIVVTNAHVVDNTIALSARSPKLGDENIQLNLVGLTRDKDLALCKISPEYISKLIAGMKNPKDLNMIIGDNMKVVQTEEVMTIGYPLGEKHIKFTTGVVAGFPSLDNEDEFKIDPTYIQITAPINPGNSGGPLINMKGEVIGINAAGHLFSQNVGYAIGSRTLLSIYDHIVPNNTDEILPVILRTPALSIKWAKTNDIMMGIKCGSPENSGIYVCSVDQDSIFDALEEGDIISHITYDDPFWASSKFGNSKSSCYDVTIKDRTPNCSTIPITGAFDNFGEIKIYQTAFPLDEITVEPHIKRKISMHEFFDIIPIGTTLSLRVCRDARWYKLDSVYTRKEIYVIPKLYLRFEPMPFEIFAGLVVSPLTINHIESFVDYNGCGIKLNKYRQSKRKHRPYVVIVQVFPNTSIYKIDGAKDGFIIKEINNMAISTLGDVREALTRSRNTITIKMSNKVLFVGDKDKIIEEDREAMKSFNVHGYEYLLTSNHETYNTHSDMFRLQ